MVEKIEKNYILVILVGLEILVRLMGVVGKVDTVGKVMLVISFLLATVMGYTKI